LGPDPAVPSCPRGDANGPYSKLRCHPNFRCSAGFQPGSGVSTFFPRRRPGWGGR